MSYPKILPAGTRTVTGENIEGYELNWHSPEMVYFRGDESWSLKDVDWSTVPVQGPFDDEDLRLSGQPVQAKPIPLLLHCPLCSLRHIDEGKFATKLHHTHACQGCGHVWRPAVEHTVGVRFLPGFKNEKVNDLHDSGAKLSAEARGDAPSRPAANPNQEKLNDLHDSGAKISAVAKGTAAKHFEPPPVEEIGQWHFVDGPIGPQVMHLVSYDIGGAPPTWALAGRFATFGNGVLYWCRLTDVDEARSVAARSD